MDANANWTRMTPRPEEDRRMQEAFWQEVSRDPRLRPEFHNMADLSKLL